MSHSRQKSIALSSKALQCRFCGRAFSRSDAVLRHSRICRLRESQLVPGPQRRGKKRSACDNCAKSKLSCDADFPCEACLFNHRACTYDRLDGTSEASGATRNCDGTKSRGSQADESALRSTTTSIRSDIPSLMQELENQTAIPFLRKYVDPDIKSLPEVFDRLSLTENGMGNVESPDNLDSSELLVQTTPIFPKYSFAGLLYDLSSNTGANLNIDDDSEHDNTSKPILTSHTIDQFQPLTPERHARFLSELTKCWTNLSSESVEACSDICINEAIELLELANIPMLIITYFEQWQRHSPVLHPNLFDPNTVSFPLLLTVVLVGAFYSSDERRLRTARMLIPVAEEWVFSSGIFTNQRNSPQVRRNPKFISCAEILSDFEALQAAFIIIKILLREGDKKKTNEVRTTMFDHIITAARALSLLHVKSPIKNLDTLPLDGFKWRELCLAETQIRLMCGIFNHDASFTVFNNTVPRLLVSELEFDMPCSVHVFDARSYQECATFILAEARPNLPPPAFLIDSYFSEKWDDCEAVIVPELTILHHFVIILGLLQKWTMRNVLGDGLSFNRMETALDRWKIGWDLCTGPLAPEDVEQIGFVKHAAIELWYLAKKTVDEATTTEYWTKPMNDQASTAPITI